MTVEKKANLVAAGLLIIVIVAAIITSHFI